MIFTQFYFSINVAMRSDLHRSYGVIGMIYSLICLFSYFNISYVRDFDTVQVNFTPIILSIAGVLALQKGFEVMLFGMVASLMADSYFGLRF